MDPTIDYDIAEINFRPRYKARKSYARDSHGFELENNYFQDPSSEEESSSSDEGSFTLSLGKGTKQQQRLSKQHGMVAMLPSGTKSDKSSHHSPSPLKTYHSPVKITSNPKKRLTFEMDSNEENRKHQRDESISESEDDGVTVAEEVLPNSYSTLDPSRRGSANKKREKIFDLGEFSDSSSDTDEDTAGIKKSFFVKQIGKDTLMCLPKLSEYIKPQQKSVAAKKKRTETQRQQNGKRKGSTFNDVVIPANTKKSRKNVHTVKSQVTREESTVEESTATEEEENTRVVRTERNPKLAKKRTTAHRHARQSTGSPVSDSSQKSFAVLQNTTTKIIDSIYGNDEQDLEEDMGAEIERSVQQRTGRPSISFTSKGEEIRQTRSSKSKVKQDVDPYVPDPRRTDVTLQCSRKRRLTTEAESEEHRHVVTHDHKQQRRSQRLLASDGETSDIAPVKVMEKQPKKKKEEEAKHDDHKQQKRLLSFEGEMNNSSAVKITEKQQQQKKKKKEEQAKHDHKQQKMLLTCEGDGPTAKVMEKQQKKKREDVPAKQKPPREVDTNKNKGQRLHKDKEKRKNTSRGNKRRKLIDGSKLLYQRDQSYVHIPVAEGEHEAMDDGTLRRSRRTRVPAINYLLGEQLIYEASASGGMVVKEIIRPTLPTTQQQSKPPKRRPKQSSANISQASKSSKSGSRVPAAKQTKPEHQRLIVDEDAEEQKPEIVNDEKSSTKKIVTMLPVSPRKNESLGSALLKGMFESDSSLATESVKIINDDGTARPPVEVVKPLQSLRLCNASGSVVTPSDPFIMAILSRQKNTNFGVAILNKMGDKGEQYTENSSVCFFLISGEVMLKIGDLELHPPVWSRIYVPEGISYTLRNLQHTPAILVYVVIKPNKDHDDHDDHD